MVVVSQSHKESSCSTESTVCTATERLVSHSCSNTSANMLLANSFFGLTSSHFALSGRTSPGPADFAAVLLAASFAGRASPDPAVCAASFLGMTHSHFCSSSRCLSGSLTLHGDVAWPDKRQTGPLPLFFAAASGGWGYWLGALVAELLPLFFAAASGDWGYRAARKYLLLHSAGPKNRIRIM